MLPNPASMIGRLPATEQLIMLPVGNWIELAPADPSRWSIGFCSASGGGLAVTTEPDDVTLSGFQVGFATALWFYFKDWGELVTKQWWGFDRGGSLAATVITCRIWQPGYDPTKGG